MSKTGTTGKAGQGKAAKKSKGSSSPAISSVKTYKLLMLITVGAYKSKKEAQAVMDWYEKASREEMDKITGRTHELILLEFPND